MSSGLEKIVILINSTPKYYYLLPLQMAMLNRYGGLLAPHIVLATEEPEHPICKKLQREYGDGAGKYFRILSLKRKDAGFLDSRAAALRVLLNEGEYEYVLPLQEDFLLDRAPNWRAIENVISFYLRPSKGYVSARLMPCPGPRRVTSEMSNWADLSKDADTYGFTFQATLWRLEACTAWYEALCKKLEHEWPRATTDPRRRIEIEVRANFAENAEGQRFFWEFFAERGEKHIAWVRAGVWSNAVYLCPWPYRPTAIVKGVLEPWAAELAKREGIPLEREGLDAAGGGGGIKGGK